MTKSLHKTVVALNLPTSDGALVGRVGLILAMMGENPDFPAPVPSLADVAKALAAFDAAVVDVKSGGKGKTAVRDAALRVLRGLMNRVKAYVQGIADENPERAASIILGSGMFVQGKRGAGKEPFEVRPGDVAGSVMLIVKAAGHRASYEWQRSLDGKTWTGAGKTLQAKIVIVGLPSATVCFFRYRVVTRAGQGDWSAPIPFLVK